jgi:hypothetical protein
MLTLVKSDDRRSQFSDEVLIHVRHLPSAEVMTIDRCPPQLSGQEWRDLLISAAPEYYQTFVGARGFFRLPRPVFDAILADVTPMAAE